MLGMNVYILRVRQLDPKDNIRCDAYDAKVVVAPMSTRARQLANRIVGDEGKIWEDNKLTSCTLVNMGKEKVLLASFVSG